MREVNHSSFSAIPYTLAPRKHDSSVRIHPKSTILLITGLCMSQVQLDLGAKRQLSPRQDIVNVILSRVSSPSIISRVFTFGRTHGIFVP